LSITTEQLKKIMPLVSATKATECVVYLNKAMERFEINTPLRQAAFLAQLAHESLDLTVWEENLNYSDRRLLEVFKKYFSNANDVKNYHRKPEKIANRVYANRMGNGDEASGDGWRYRGRGVIMLTGKGNYSTYGALLNVDLIDEPDLASTTLVAFIIAANFWDMHKLNTLADKQDIEGITKRINGGLNGLSDRKSRYERALKVLGVE